MRGMCKNTKGVTLIALIITIIVLLILAGVVFNVISGDNGILSRAAKAGEEAKIAEYKQQIEMEIMDKQMDENDLYGVTLDKLKTEEYVDDLGQIEKDGYIYEIDEDLTVKYIEKATIIIRINPNGGFGDTATVTITVDEYTTKLKSDSLKYAWHTTNNLESPPSIWEDAVSGVPLAEKTVIGEDTSLYLWVKAKDTSEKEHMKVSKAFFKTDEIAPTISYSFIQTETGVDIKVNLTDDVALKEVKYPNGVIEKFNGEKEKEVIFSVTENKKLTFEVFDYFNSTVKEIAEIETIQSNISASDGIVPMIYNNEYADGTHTITVNGESYEVEVINFRKNIVYNETNIAQTLGSATTEGPMLVLKYHQNLIVEGGQTVIPQVRRKGMYICVKGKLTNRGIISMTGRGCGYGSSSQNVYLYKETDSLWDNGEFVPGVGGVGGNLRSAYGNLYAGLAGTAGSNRSTGGGRWRRCSLHSCDVW